MNPESIFFVQFGLSLVAWTWLLTVMAGPWFAERPDHSALAWLALPHAFRHVGLVFLVPGVVAESLPPGFANPAAYGDLAAGFLALMTLVALHRRWAVAIPLAWTYSVVGSLDLAYALSHQAVIPKFGSTWYIPTILVPLLLVTHVMSFRVLLKRTVRTVSGAGGAAAAKG